MKTAAKGYFLQGLNIIPVRGKQPLIRWEKWQTEKQTEANFDSLPWDEADGFAVIGGSRVKDGFYICAIDFDVKNLSPEIVGKGRVILNKFPMTKMEETPSGGQHWIYLCHTKPKTVSIYHNQCALELLGENKLIIVFPSEDYKRLNDNNPSEISDIEIVFIRILRESGFAESSALDSWFGQASQKPYEGAAPPCITRLLKDGASEGIRNETAIRLSSYLSNFRRLSDDRILQKMQEWNSNNSPPLEESELRNIIESSINGKYVYGCSDSILEKYCKLDICPLKPKNTTISEKIKTAPFFELPDGCLAEQGFDGKHTYFLVFDPKTCTVEKQSEIKIDEITYKPIENEEAILGLTLFPCEATDFGTDKKLLEEITVYMNRWHETPSEKDRKLDALYVLLTYISDILPKVPYRRMLGALGRGKSAWIDTVGSICYRPIRLAGCDTDKAICRRLNIWRGTALIDEADFGKTDLYAFITKILNLGYDQKQGFYQRCQDENSTQTVTYRVYGPKLLATRDRYTDQALESRCITTIAHENSKSMPLFRMERFATEAQTLRDKLIFWRFRKYHEMKQKVAMLESPELSNELKIDNISSRIKEILAPLALVSEEFRPNIAELAIEIDTAMRNDRDYQLEMEFNEALARIMDETERDSGGSYGSYGPIGSPTLEVPSITDFLGESTQPNSSQKNGGYSFHVSLTRIAKKILCNENPESKELTSLTRSLSNMIRTRLGLKIIQGTGGRRLIEIPEAYIKTVTTATTATKPKYKIIKIV